MSNLKNNIVLVINITHINIYKQLVNSLIKSFNVTIVVLEKFQNHEFMMQKGIFDDLEVEFFLYNDLFGTITPFKPKKNNSFMQYLIEFTTALKFKYSYNQSVKFLKENNIYATLHPQDISLSNIGLLKASYDLNIPAIIPSAIMMEPEESFHKGKLEYQLHKASTFYEKNIFNKKYSKYIRYKNLFFYTAPILNFLKKFDLLSSTPWLYGGSHLTKYLCVSNKYHKNISTENGIDEKKIKIVGDINYDELYSNYKKNFNKKDIIVLAVPQFFEHNYCSLKEARDRIEYLVEISSSIEQYELVLSLHPSMDIKDYTYLENRYNCSITLNPLYEVLPSAKLFICSQSNTIIWSTLCHIKTIVADFYEWNYTTSDKLTSCYVIKEKEQFNKNKITNILNKTIDFTHDDKLLSRELVFNGKVCQSYIDLLLSVDNENKTNKVNKYFTPHIYIYLKYKLYKKEYKIKQIKNKIDKYNNFYISPYNDMTQELEVLLNNDKFSGYIDSYKKNEYIKDIDSIDISNSCIIILSPNYSKEIYNRLKKIIDNTFILNY